MISGSSAYRFLIYILLILLFISDKQGFQYVVKHNVYLIKISLNAIDNNWNEDEL